MKLAKGFMVLGLLLVGGAVWAGDNRELYGDIVKPTYREIDSRYVVRFSTIIPANTTTMLVSTQTARSLGVAPGINYSPTLVASTTVTMGGRIYMTFQVVDAVSNVHVDLNSGDTSTATSPYLTEGQWWSPDDPVAYQGAVYARSASTACLTGYIYFAKPR